MNTLLQHLWNYFLFAGTFFFAAGAVAIPPAAPESAPVTPATPAAPAAPAAPVPAADPRELRQAYEGIKSKYEPWEKLGVQPDQVGHFQTVYQKVFTEAASVGRHLGYADAEIEEALREDPIKTVEFLRNEAQRSQQGQQSQAGGEQDLNELVSQAIQQQIGPIQERENQRMTQEGNALFERTVHQCAVDAFKSEGIDVTQIPQDEMYLLTSGVSEILKYDENALRDLKYNGKTAAVQAAFQEMKTTLDKYYLARAGRDRARVSQPVRQGQPAALPEGGRRPTLNEMIDNPSLIDEAQGRRGQDGRYRA